MSTGQGALSPTAQKELDIRRSLDMLEGSVDILTDRISKLYDKQTFVMSCCNALDKEAPGKPVDGSTPMSQCLNSINDRIQCNTATINFIINQTEF